MEEEEKFAASNKRLWTLLPPDQRERVFNSENCELERDFLGFVDIYERLSQIIPLHWTVVDLGCAYAAQAFFFAGHKKYVGIDLLTPNEARFHTSNSEHHFMPISEYLEIRAVENRSTTFAICSYVPPWHGDNGAMVRGAFENLFVFYPAGGQSVMPLMDAAPLPARAGEGGEG